MKNAGKLTLMVTFKGQKIITERTLPEQIQSYTSPDAVAGAMDETWREVWADTLTKMEQVDDETGGPKQ